VQKFWTVVLRLAHYCWVQGTHLFVESGEKCVHSLFYRQETEAEGDSPLQMPEGTFFFFFFFLVGLGF
jgi:hypothetical protein